MFATEFPHDAVTAYRHDALTRCHPDAVTAYRHDALIGCRRDAVTP